MTSRLQVTEIEASTSSALRVGDVGVVQGSLTGPLWYVLYTSELSEVVHGQNCTWTEDQPEPLQNQEETAQWKAKSKFKTVNVEQLSAMRTTLQRVSVTSTLKS